MPAAAGAEQRHARQVAPSRSAATSRSARRRCGRRGRACRARSSSCGGPFGSQPSSSSPHPLHAHRPADRLRQQRRIGRRVIVAVHAVAAGAVEIDHAHLVARQTEQSRRTCCGSGGWPARRSRPWRCRRAHRRPRRTARSSRATGSARNSSPIASSRRPARRRAASPLLTIVSSRGTGRCAPVAASSPLLGQAAPSAPLRLSARGAHGPRPLVLGDDAEEILDRGRPHAGQMPATDALVDRHAAWRRPPAAGSRGRAACRGP